MTEFVESFGLIAFVVAIAYRGVHSLLDHLTRRAADQRLADQRDTQDLDWEKPKRKNDEMDGEIVMVDFTDDSISPSSRMLS